MNIISTITNQIFLLFSNLLLPQSTSNNYYYYYYYVYIIGYKK